MSAIGGKADITRTCAMHMSAFDLWIVVLRNVPKVFFAQAASIARQVWAPTANGVNKKRCRCRTAKCWIGLCLKLIGKRGKVDIGS